MFGLLGSSKLIVFVSLEIVTLRNSFIVINSYIDRFKIFIM